MTIFPNGLLYMYHPSESMIRPNIIRPKVESKIPVCGVDGCVGSVGSVGADGLSQSC